MDNFMDNIVQKFTPQDMIRANAAADAAEIESLEKQLTIFKEQMDKYDDCLQEMRRVNLKNIESAQDVQQLTDKAGEKLGQTISEIETESVSRIKEASDITTASISRMVDESLAKITEIKGETDNTQAITDIVTGLQQNIEGVLKNLEDFLHTDNVKVYRNVQAAMIEELEKQTTDIKDSQDKMNRKCGILFPFVLTTMILSLAGLVLSLLQMFGIL